jgi:hypothetical protein
MQKVLGVKKCSYGKENEAFMRKDKLKIRSETYFQTSIFSITLAQPNLAE